MASSFEKPTKADIAKSSIIGVFILIGFLVGTTAFTCVSDCPKFTQAHFDEFVNILIYLGYGGMLYIGIKSIAEAKKALPSLQIKKKENSAG